MFLQKKQFKLPVRSETYPLGEPIELPLDGGAMALVALSHTHFEHRIYTAMFSEVSGAESHIAPFSIRALMTLTGIRSSSTVRRGLEGLRAKLSIERQHNGNGESGKGYLIRCPEEILAQRNAMGVELYPRAVRFGEGNGYFERAVKRVAANANLSRREAQVALCCVEGLTNAEIGRRLEVSEQTVKFHLRHVFIKFGVRRRAELISRLLM
jgi:DNA-binding CsgD family transcriptional regulator